MVWVLSAFCLGTLSGEMSETYAMGFEHEETGCDSENNMNSMLQCCESRDQTQDGAVNITQTQPLPFAGPALKPTFDEPDYRLFKPVFRVLNTSSPPKNLPGVIVKKE